MDISGNTILITGGATGIGYAIAKRFSQAGSKVILIGRSFEKLEAAQKENPDIVAYQCDLTNPDGRIALFNWVTTEYPDLNALVNNAGIQNMINLTQTGRDWCDYENEIRTNLDAPIHLSMLFIPFLMDKKQARIINVSSGLGLTPAAWVPVYTATKSGLHFFSRAMRLQLKNTGIKVTEILPPMVNTDLGGAGQHNAGTPVDEFADAVISQLKDDVDEIGYDTSAIALSDDYSPDTVKKNAELWWNGFSKASPEFDNLI